MNREMKQKAQLRKKFLRQSKEQQRQTEEALQQQTALEQHAQNWTRPPQKVRGTHE